MGKGDYHGYRNNTRYGRKEEPVQIIKRRTFQIPQMGAAPVQDIVMDLTGPGRKELMEIMAHEAYDGTGPGFQDGMKELDNLVQEMIQVVETMKKELDDELPFH